MGVCIDVLLFKETILLIGKPMGSMYITISKLGPRSPSAKGF